MDDLVRVWSGLIGRLTGPLTFRLVLQPSMAVFYAARIYPLELVIVVLSLAFIPYLLLREPVNRLARYWTA